ncbi:MAG: carboxypeptidase-like regulatory domain-containing protein [Chitinophagaceae bacterium]
MNKIYTFLTIIACTLLGFTSTAQSSLLKGKIVHEDTMLPYADVQVTIPSLKTFAITNGDGEYTFSNIPTGSYEIILSADGITEKKVNIQVNESLTQLEDIVLESSNKNQNNFTIENSGASLQDGTSDDNNTENTSGQNIASVLNAARDPYLSAATFGWGQYFYKIRGYENDNSYMYLNGVPMNDLEEGGIFYNSFSGLNDVFRGRSVSLGLAPIDNTFGALGLNTNLDATASNQRKGTRLTYTLTNRSYRNRLMLTHNSGLMKSGWAYSFSVSKRWANEGQIKGTYYNAYGYFAAVEKRFKKHGFNISLIGAPVERGKNGPATDETFDLAGTHYYNPYWGYQDGKIRNSRVLKSHSPLVILTHDARLNENTQITTAISYQAGETSTSTLDWYNAADPRPDYYRYLPSYQDSIDLTNSVANQIKNDPEKYLQVNWDGLYEANYLNKKAGYNRSVYILGADVEKSKKLNAAVNLQSIVTDHITVHSGISYQTQNNHDFRRVEDLLGGDYWVNINQFAEDGIQGVTVSTKLNEDESDLTRKVGDTYGYDYNIHFNKAAWYAQGVFVYNKFDFFLGGELGYTNFYRTGNYRHGLYQNDSKGNSDATTFFTYKTKGGITYKLNGRNYIYANGSIGTRAPYIDNIFISPRTRNTMVENPRVEKISSGELGYLLRSPFIKGRLTFFATEVKNAVDIKRFYNDFGASFSNYVIQNINKRYTGLEAGLEIKMSPSLTLNLAGALTQAFYTSRATARTFNDNDAAIGSTTASDKVDTLYIKNYYVPSGPQTAFQTALNYRSKRFWFASITFNYLANNWIDFAPARRTTEGVDLLAYDSKEWHDVIDQQKLPSFYTIDLFGGKSFKVDKYIKKAGYNTYFNIQLGITNLLNNQNIKLYGFENLRVGSATSQPDWFVPKSAYALGIQYFINMNLRF